jgi:hypothetical protein
MPNTSSSAILRAWKARIEALVPVTQAGPDDRYHVAIGMRIAYMGSRAVILSCQPGRRVQGGRTCSDWETVTTIEAFYLDHGQDSYLQACEDAEQIVDDIYDWIASNDGQNLGLLRAEPDLANIAGAEGELQLVRTIRFVYDGRN